MKTRLCKIWTRHVPTSASEEKSTIYQDGFLKIGILFRRFLQKVWWSVQEVLERAFQVVMVVHVILDGDGLKIHNEVVGAGTMESLGQVQTVRK